MAGRVCTAALPSFPKRFWRDHGGCANTCESSKISTSTNAPLMQPCLRSLAFSGRLGQTILPSQKVQTYEWRTRLALPRTLARDRHQPAQCALRPEVEAPATLSAGQGSRLLLLDRCEAEPEVSPSPCTGTANNVWNISRPSSAFHGQFRRITAISKTQVAHQHGCCPSSLMIPR